MHFKSAGDAPAARLDRRGERGQSLIFFAGALGLLCAVLGLVLDGSNLQLNRRKLQNAADAAAFAGAYDLTASPSQATTDSIQWLTKNGSGQTEVTTNAVSTSPNGIPNDTITVSLLRTVPYSVMKVMGLTSGNVIAGARVQVQATTGMWLSNPDFMTYAVWRWKSGTTCTGDAVPHAVSDIVYFSSNSWTQMNVPSSTNNCDWQVSGNDFKGFMSPPGPATATVNDGDQLLSGGQQCGTQGQAPYVQQLQTIYNNPDSNGHSIVLLPIVYKAVQDHTIAAGAPGSIKLWIDGFVAVDIRVDPNILSGCPQDFYGQIVPYTGVSGVTGGVPAPPDLSCGSGIGVCTAKLVPWP